MAATSEVSDGILPKFKFIGAFIVGLVICKNEEDSSKNLQQTTISNFAPFSKISNKA